MIVVLQSFMHCKLVGMTRVMCVKVFVFSFYTPSRNGRNRLVVKESGKEGMTPFDCFSDSFVPNFPGRK